MNTPRYSVPYNGDPKIIDFFIKNKQYINDVYFGLPHDILPSGRVIELNEFSNNTLNILFKMLEKLKKNNIKCSLVMNRSCEGKDTFSKNLLKKYIEIIEKFTKKKLINYVILSNPFYITKLKEKFSDILFMISVNSNINSLFKAKYINKMGFDIIILDRDINENKSLIKKIKKHTCTKIKLLVNESCIKECVFRTNHFNLLSHHTSKIKYKERIPCVKIFEKKPWTLLKSSFILPRDLSEYDKFVDIYKLAGRSIPTKILKYQLNAYFKRIETGDLLSIISSYGLHTWKASFIKKNNKIPYVDIKKIPKNYKQIISNCNYDCAECKFCEQLWFKILENY